MIQRIDIDASFLRVYNGRPRRVVTGRRKSRKTGGGGAVSESERYGPRVKQHVRFCQAKRVRTDPNRPAPRFALERLKVGMREES
jgi:hypothetical protein